MRRLSMADYQWQWTLPLESPPVHVWPTSSLERPIVVVSASLFQGIETTDVGRKLVSAQQTEPIDELAAVRERRIRRVK